MQQLQRYFNMQTALSSNRNSTQWHQFRYHHTTHLCQTHTVLQIEIFFGNYCLSFSHLSLHRIWACIQLYYWIGNDLSICHLYNNEGETKPILVTTSGWTYTESQSSCWITTTGGKIDFHSLRWYLCPEGVDRAKWYPGSPKAGLYLHPVGQVRNMAYNVLY